jgi:hypothetical protein
MLTSSVVEVTKRVEKLENTVSKMQSEGASNAVSPELSKNIVNESAKMVISELQEIDSRKRNVMFFGVTESTDASAEVRKAYDESMIKKIGDHLGIDSANYEVRVCFRLGKKQSERAGHPVRPRPLKVVFNAETAKFAFLAKINVLQHRPYSNLKIGIKEDLSPMQQETEATLLKELREKRADPSNAGEKYV